MDKYRKIVEKAQKTKSDEKILNSSIEHARILIDKILGDAKSNIKILSDNFDDTFYRDMQKTFQSVLESNSLQTLEIITKTDTTSTVLETLKAKYGKKIVHKTLDYNTFPSSYKDHEKINYIVTDNNSYRFEFSDAYLAEGRVDAVACFNDKDNATKLIANFNTLFQASSLQ